MATPVGPLFAAGSTNITKSGYKITFLPDAHNDELQRAGQPPIYYWMPNEVRLAKKDNGDFRFSMIHFAGVRSSSTTVGATSQDDEVAGGLVTFGTISAPPGDVLTEAQNDLLNQLRGSEDKYWGLRTNVPPMFRFFPIVSNSTSLSNISPTQDGQLPAVTPSTPTPATPPAAGGAAPAPGRTIVNRNAPPIIRASPIIIPTSARPRTVPQSYRGTNLDPMFVHVSGQGSGSINPDAENAYSALLGAIPAAIVYNSFHMGTGSVVVYQNLMCRVVSPLMTIDIHGDWSRIQDHFSAAAKAGGLFWSVDIQAQFDSLRESGEIEVKTFVDASLPNADKLQQYMDQKSDLVFQKFMDLAKTTIFDPAPFNEKPAEASTGPGNLGSIFGGGGVAMKLRKQKVSLTLDYHETKEMAYLQSYPISGTMDGLYDVLKADPTAEKKYFLNVDLGDWDRKVARIVKPVVNWPDQAQQWVGEPVAFLSAQIGYPNSDGDIQWDGHVFGPADGPAAQWNTATLMKKLTDVAKPPQGWAPDQTYVKRQIHFTEPPSAISNPYARVQVEKDLVDLDPGDLGQLTSDITLEIRVEDTGTLAVGPIFLGANLDAPSQVVEITFQAKGNRDDGRPRDAVKMSWTMSDQDKPRYWLVYTGNQAFEQKYQYQVHVIVKGSLFTKGMEWTGPWTDGAASGALTVSIPTPDDAGVTKKDMPLGLGAANPSQPPATSQPAVPLGASNAPPPTRSAPSLLGYNVGPPATTGRSAPSSKEVVFSGFMPAP